jgi:hypothetical protein
MEQLKEENEDDHTKTTYLPKSLEHYADYEQNV